MGSSPGFGSARRDAQASLDPPCSDSRSLRVRPSWGPYPAAPSNSPAHSSIGTRSGPPGGGRPSLTVGRRFQGLFHSPRRGAFHLSLAVLVRYRSLGVFSLGPWSARLPAGFLVSRGTHGPAPGRRLGAGYGAVTPCGAPSQALRLPSRLLTPRGPGEGLRAGRPTPPPHRLAGHSAAGVWAPPRSLAATCGISSMSAPRGTEMFQFPRCPSPSRVIPAYDRGGVAPFGYSRISACWRLPGTFRRLLRPSSAPSAKASTVCPYSLSVLPARSAAERAPTLCRQN
jgi:hypothetical protein